MFWNRKKAAPPLFDRLADHMVADASRIRALEQRLADTEADYHRWHDAYLRLKYPNMGERIHGTQPCKHCDGSGVTANDPAAFHANFCKLKYGEDRCTCGLTANDGGSEHGFG